jgi:uncharacterized protein (DUF433 family)
MMIGMDSTLTTHPDPPSVASSASLSREHIVRTVDTCGGKPRIAGHRIRVQDVVVWHEKMGMSAEEIVSEYPGITLADVHAALTYYYDHVEEVRGYLREEEALAADLEARLPSLSGAITAGRDAKDDPISSR